MQSHKIVECQSSAVSYEMPSAKSFFDPVLITFFSVPINIFPSKFIEAFANTETSLQEWGRVEKWLEEGLE